MKKIQRRKLTLSRETLHYLQDDTFEQAAGGDIDITIVTWLFSCVATRCGSCTGCG